MSVREEEKQKSCSNRGLGIAAAALSVGVGAALYYFYNKRSENPNSEGSTSGWTCEQPHALQNTMYEEDESYTTISEHSTSDTSMHDTSADSTTDSYVTEAENNTSTCDTNMNSSSDTSSESLNSSESDIESEMSVDESESNFDSDSDLSLGSLYMSQRNSIHSEVATLITNIYQPGQTLELPRHGAALVSAFISRYPSELSDSDVDWDITTSSVDVPSESRRSPLMTFIDNFSMRASPRRRRPTEQEQMTMLRDQAFRDRSWALEECSICFEAMQQTQEVMALPCTHRFHQQCILPWLQEQQTCPNCRKVAECKSSHF